MSEAQVTVVSYLVAGGNKRQIEWSISYTLLHFHPCSPMKIARNAELFIQRHAQHVEQSRRLRRLIITYVIQVITHQVVLRGNTQFNAGYVQRSENACNIFLF